MDSPVATRMAAQSPGGLLGPSGVANFRRLYSGQDKAEPFHQWASLTGTRLLRDALRDIALHTPPGLTGVEDPLVQYGMSLGLSLAARLMEDPSSVFPELFTSVSGASSEFNPLGVRDDYGADPFDDATQEN